MTDIRAFATLLAGKVTSDRLPNKRTPILIRVTDQFIYTKSEYDERIIELIRAIPGRNWDSAQRIWKYPKDRETLLLVMDLPNAKILEDDVIKVEQLLVSSPTPKKKSITYQAPPNRDYQIKPLPKIPGLKKTLYPFQVETLKFIESRNGRAYLALDMGLGKTPISLAWLELHPELRPAIVVCPASLKFNWNNEIQTTISTNNNTSIIQGTTASKINNDIIIINYDVLENWVEFIKKINPKVLIVDEAHYIKNFKAIRTKKVLELGRKIPHILCLSGTPITNKPVEFYYAIRLIDAYLFPNRHSYRVRYCGGENQSIQRYNKATGKRETRTFLTDGGSSNTLELHKILSDTIMIRKTKEEVLPDLPPKIKTVISLDVSNLAEYREAKAEFVNWLAESNYRGGALTLQKLAKLKDIAVKGKLPGIIEWIENTLESSQKIIVFCIHHWVVNELIKKFGKIAVKYTGEESPIQKQDAEDKFKNDPNTKIFVANIKAGGVGLNLQVSPQVAFAELDWVPANHDQAEDRSHRIGQDKTVQVTYFVAEGTIETDIMAVIDKKREVVTQVVDGKEADYQEMLTYLVNKFKEDNQ